MAKNTTPAQIQATQDIIQHPAEYRAAEIDDLPTLFLVESAWELDKAITALGGNAPFLRFWKQRLEYSNLNRDKKQ